MIKTFVNETTSKTTNKYRQYIKDLQNIIINLDLNNIYICNTTLNTFYFVSLILAEFNFPYISIRFPLQNCPLILSPKSNLYLNNLEKLSGINKSRINILFEKIFEKKIIYECCICYNKNKSNNICYSCYQYNGCAKCGKKLFNKNLFNCVLCKL